MTAETYVPVLSGLTRPPQSYPVGLARGGHHAGRIGHHGLAAGLFCPTAYPKPHSPLRPGSYPVGRPVLRQRLPRALAPARGRTFAESPRSYPVGRVLRQRPTGYDPGRKPTQGFGCLWSRLKTEVLELREWPVFADLADAQARIADYFDYYNHDRLNSSIGCQTPYRTHQQLLQTTALNCPA